MVFVMISIFCIASAVSAGPLRHRPIREKISPFGEKGVASPSFIEQGLLNRRLSICSASIDLPPGSSSAVPEFAYCASSSSNPPSSYASLSGIDPPHSSDCLGLKLSLNSQSICHVDNAIVKWNNQPKISTLFPLSPEGANNGHNSDAILPPLVPANSAHPLSLELSLNSQWSLDSERSDRDSFEAFAERSDRDSFEAFAPLFIATLTSALNNRYLLQLKSTILSNDGWEVIHDKIIGVSRFFLYPLHLFLLWDPPVAVEWLRDIFCVDSHRSQYREYFPVLQENIKAAAPVVPTNAGPLFYSKLHAAVVTVSRSHIDDIPTMTEWAILAEPNAVLKWHHAEIFKKILLDPNSTTREEIFLNGLIGPTLYIVKALQLNQGHCQDVLDKVVAEIATNCIDNKNDSIIERLKLHVTEALSDQTKSLSTNKSSLLAQYLWDLYKERLKAFVSNWHDILALIYIKDQIAIHRSMCFSFSDSMQVQLVEQLINTLNETGRKVKIYQNRVLALGAGHGDLFSLKISPRFAKMFEENGFVLEKAKQSFILYLTKI